MRGDWPAICEFLGMRIWAHKLHPCLFCTTSKSELGQYEGVSIDDAPWSDYTRDNYDNEIAGCTINVKIQTLHDRYLISQALKYDYNKFGRALHTNLPRFSLLKGDRLEPSEQFIDIGELESHAVPVDVCFLRCTKNTRLVHKSLLL